MKNQTYFDKVYAVTKLIPKGKVSTYGHIADFLALGSARMVGWALNHSDKMDNIPAHRVVNRKGELTGRNQFPLPDMMQKRLESESLTIVNHKIQNFDTHLWIPGNHLDQTLFE